MFIEFPDSDFQFEVTESDDIKALSEWFTSNEVSPIFSQRMNKGYFTVRSKTMYYAFNDPVESLPVLKLYSTDKLLLNNIIKAVLKELGYYRKGMKDPVIQYMLNFINNPSINIPSEPHILVNMISFRNFMCFMLLPEGRAKYNKDHLYAISFYQAIWNLTVGTYLTLKNIQPVNMITEDSYIIRSMLSNIENYRSTFVNNYSFHSCFKVQKPKQVIRNIKSELKPTVVGNEQLAHDIIGELENV